MDYLVVGRLGKPHGLRGELEVTVITDFPERFDPGNELLIIPPLPGSSSLVIEASRAKKNKVVVKFVGIDSIDQAVTIRGRELGIAQEQAGTPVPGTFWQHDLLGLKVLTVSGEVVGTVAEVIRSGAHDLYAVDNGKRHLIPAVKGIIVSIDVVGGTMVIDPPPGLLEL